MVSLLSFNQQSIQSQCCSLWLLLACRSNSNAELCSVVCHLQLAEVAHNCFPFMRSLQGVPSSIRMSSSFNSSRFSRPASSAKDKHHGNCIAASRISSLVLARAFFPAARPYSDLAVSAQSRASCHSLRAKAGNRTFGLDAASGLEVGKQQLPIAVEEKSVNGCLHLHCSCPDDISLHIPAKIDPLG